MSRPFEPQWYYEMGKDAAKHPEREMSNGAFAMLVFCFIIALALFGGAVALLVWAFAS